MLAQVVNVLILKVKDIAIVAAKNPFFSRRWIGLPSQFCVCNTHKLYKLAFVMCTLLSITFKLSSELIHLSSFLSADEAQQLRSVLHTLFSPDSVATFQSTIDRYSYFLLLRSPNVWLIRIMVTFYWERNKTL